LVRESHHDAVPEVAGPAGACLRVARLAQQSETK
jgi:hypothetical protein